MAIVDELGVRLREAMKARDERTVSVLRMVRARIMDRQNEKAFTGPMTDEIVLDVIGAYVKQLKKAIPEFEVAGEAGKPAVEKLVFEVDYLSRFLPRLLDEAETEKLVVESIASLGVTDPRRVGQVMGAIMKTHKGVVDPDLVRRLVEKKLDSDREAK